MARLRTRWRIEESARSMARNQKLVDESAEDDVDSSFAVVFGICWSRSCA